MLDINLRTPFILTQFFLEELQKGSGSCIVNISCDKGSRPEPGLVAYCMAKAGLEMLTKTTAVELGAVGIRVNAVAPCFIQTTNESNLYRYSGLSEAEVDSLKKRAGNNIPLVRKLNDEQRTSADDRVVRDHEVAKAVIFLTSEMARTITGHVMHVDGGKTLTSKGQ